MNILFRNDGLMLLEQYDKCYIRFMAGGFAEMPYQVAIDKDEKRMIVDGTVTMASVLNRLSNDGLCERNALMENLLLDYLDYTTKYSISRKRSIIEKLKRFSDIYFEFYYYVLRERFDEYGVSVEGYSASKLAANYPLSALGAYNYLIYLRDDPTKALAALKAGLPRK